MRWSLFEGKGETKDRHLEWNPTADEKEESERKRKVRNTAENVGWDVREGWIAIGVSIVDMYVCCNDWEGMKECRECSLNE